jgi:hypothetical protein
MWSRTHQPILVLFTSWWKSASTLHLYQFKGGNTVSMKWNDYKKKTRSLSNFHKIWNYIVKYEIIS